MKEQNRKPVADNARFRFTKEEIISLPMKRFRFSEHIEVQYVGIAIHVESIRSFLFVKEVVELQLVGNMIKIGDRQTADGTGFFISVSVDC